MPLDVRVVIVSLYCLSASLLLAFSMIHPLKSILFTLLTSAALFLVLEKFQINLPDESQD